MVHDFAVISGGHSGTSSGQESVTAGRSYVFISGLPRSGSTLLCNILAQNPALYVSPATSGLCDVLFGIRNQYDTLVEHQAEGINYSRLRRILAAVIDCYHHTDRKIIVDKSRGWLSLIEMVEAIHGPAKILVPVRDINEILASMEKLWRKTTGQTQWQFEQNDYFLAQTVAGRCEIWSRRDQLVGLAYNRLRDALQRGHADKLHLVEFDDLTNRPEATMTAVYQFLDLEPYQHNFDYVTQYTQENDTAVHRIPDLHTIRPKIQTVPHRAGQILGRDLANKYSGLEFWR